MRNLLISPVGDYSLHHYWLRDKIDFDVFLIYYGEHTDVFDKYKSRVKYCYRMVGTKFNMLKEILDQFDILDYDYIFVPDDDLVIYSEQINQLFNYANEYNLELCQPSIVGYYDVPMTLNTPASLLRYTNFVEVMCPCFSNNALKKCSTSFDASVSCWGIDLWWHKIMGYPNDKFAIIDDIIAIHTRKCFGGENYKNNNITEPWNDLKRLIEREGLSEDRLEYSKIWKNIVYPTSAECFYPHTPYVKNLCETLRKKWVF